MTSIHLPGWLPLFIALLAFAGSYQSYPLLVTLTPLSTRFADTMDPTLQKFVESLKLPSQKAHATLQTLENDTNTIAFLNNKGDRTGLTTAVCKALGLVLDKEQVDTGAIDDALVQASWSQACWLTPTCVVLPQSSSDVSKILAFIHFFKIRFAVRSGGHSPNPGWSTLNEPGLLIDLQRLDDIRLSDDKKVASIGPGARWIRVYEVLDPYGVSVIGGRIPPVGVGGLILGGGLFHFSGEYGLAADNVRNFEVILADGTLVNANAQENRDLFWALKGGGPNFGIVTKFELYTVPVHDIWYKVNIHTPDQVPALLEAFAEWQRSGALDLKSTVALSIGLDAVILGLIYSTPDPQLDGFAPFDGILPVTVAVPPTVGTVLGITQILAGIVSNTPQRHDYRGASSGIDAQLYKDVYEIWRQQALAVREATGANQTFVLQPIPAGLAKAGLAKGGNPTGILQEDHQWWTTLIDWDNAADDATVRSASIATTDALNYLSQERGLHIPYIFMNDASRDQNPLASYGQYNVNKLKAIAAQYDPSQVFQKLQNGGFLLSRV